MAKLIEYDIEGVEESGGGTGVKVPVGLRVCRIAKCETREKKRDGTPANDIEVALDFGPEYDWLFTYVGLDVEWKLAEFIRALGLKEKGKLNPSQQVGKLVRCKVNPGEYQGEYRPEAGKLLQAQADDEVGAVSQVSQQAAGNGAVAEPETAVAEAAADGFQAFREGEPSPEDGQTVSSYDDWPVEDLEAEVNDRGLTIPGGRGSKEAKLVAALRADDSEYAEAAGGAAEPAAVANGDAGDDYEGWELDQLKTEWEARGFDDPVPTFRGSGASERVKTAIIEALRGDDAENPFT